MKQNVMISAVAALPIPTLLMIFGYACYMDNNTSGAWHYAMQAMTTFVLVFAIAMFFAVRDSKTRA